MDDSELDGVMNSAQAAAAIGCSTRTVARLVAEHRIGCVRWGAGRRRPRIGFTTQHIQEYLTSCQVFAELPPDHRRDRVGARLERRIARDPHT
jgi:excisionase family DNA binding protein